MKNLKYFIPVLFLFSACAVVSVQNEPPKKGSEKPSEYGTETEFGENGAYPLQPAIAPAEYATGIRPDQQPEQDYPSPSNWEFYSQKDGTPPRRANADSVGKMFRPDFASLDTTDRNRFIFHGDTAYYKNFYGDSAAIGLLSASGSALNLYTISGNILADTIRNVNIDSTATLRVNYPNGNVLAEFYGGEDSLGAEGFVAFKDPTQEAFLVLGQNDRSIAMVSPTTIEIGDRDAQNEGEGFMTQPGLVFMGNALDGSDRGIEIDLGTNVNSWLLPTSSSVLQIGDTQNDQNGTGIQISNASSDIQIGDIYGNDETTIILDAAAQTIAATAPNIFQAGDLNGDFTGMGLQVDATNGVAALANTYGADNAGFVVDVSSESVVNMFTPTANVRISSAEISANFEASGGFFKAASQNSGGSVSQFQIDTAKYELQLQSDINTDFQIFQSANVDGYGGYPSYSITAESADIAGEYLFGVHTLRLNQYGNDGGIVMGDIDNNINGFGLQVDAANEEIYIGNGFGADTKRITIENNKIQIDDPDRVSVQSGTAEVDIRDNDNITALVEDAGATGYATAVLTAPDGGTNLGGVVSLRASYSGDSKAAGVLARSNTTGTGQTAQAVLYAFDASATNTANEVRCDTNGVQLLTQGGTGSAGSVLQSDGAYSFWAGEGTFSADQLSFGSVGGISQWVAVPANRSTSLIGTIGTAFPSESVTEIIADTASTTSTVNLNYTPDSRFNSPFTTVRYITNFGSGNMTVDTDQSWLFKTPTTSAGTLIIGSGESYKLVWSTDFTPARFICIQLK